MKKSETKRVNPSFAANQYAKNREQVVITPKNLYKKLNDEYHFDFDPCPVNPPFDGLSIPWGKSNYVNPPYNNIGAWLNKAIQERQLGKQSVFLIPANRSATLWFHKYIVNANPKPQIRWMKGRVKFAGYKKAAPFPTMLVIYRGLDAKKTKKRKMSLKDIFADYERSRNLTYMENGKVKLASEKPIIEPKPEKKIVADKVPEPKNNQDVDKKNEKESRFNKYKEEDLAYLEKMAKEAPKVPRPKIAVSTSGIPHRKVQTEEERLFRLELARKKKELNRKFEEEEYLKWKSAINDKELTPIKEPMRKKKPKEEVRVEYFEEDGEERKVKTIKVKKPKKSSMVVSHPEEHEHLILKPKTPIMNGNGSDPEDYDPEEPNEPEQDTTPSSAEEEEISLEPKNIQKKKRVV